MNETDIKEEMNKRDLPDSFTMGSATKSGALKVYFNLEDVDAAQKKIDAFFKTKEYIARKYSVVI